MSWGRPIKNVSQSDAVMQIGRGVVAVMERYAPELWMMGSSGLVYTAKGAVMTPPTDLLVKVQTLQNMMIAHATGSAVKNSEFISLRAELVGDPRIRDRLPRIVHACRDVGQFWAYIKKFDTWRERRGHIWAEFKPLLDFLEGVAITPADDRIDEVLASFDVDSVHRAWARALERRADDPEGAITAARTLLETVCKHILDDLGANYEEGADLPKLYRLTADQLNLAPSQHTEQIFKQILGGCQSVIEGLGALRNRLSDAHGKGKSAVRPASRHAELAVNLAGSMATFLVQTWEARRYQRA